MPVPRSVLLLLGCAAFSSGCNSILGLGDYNVAADGGVPVQGQGGSCNWEPSSGQCYPCDPTKDLELLNACTVGTCVPFDDETRVTKLPKDGGLPPVPERAPEDAAAHEDGPGPEDAAEGGGGG